MNNIKFSAQYIEVPTGINLGDIVWFTGEGEVTKEEKKSTGIEDDPNIIHTVRPKLVQVKAAQNELTPPTVVHTTKVSDKSPSKRLRAVIYTLWQQQYSGKYKFENFYEQVMEKIINNYKEKLA